MVQDLIFFNKKINIGRLEHSLKRHPLRPITSHFCLTPHSPQSGRHMFITPKVFSHYLYSLKHTSYSYKCNTPRCQVGKQVKEYYAFSSYVTKETCKINHYFDFNSKKVDSSDIL